MTPRSYGFSGSITSAATKTIWGVTATAAVRPAIQSINISSNAAPANNSAEWQLLRFTAAGTSSAVVPTGFDGIPTNGDPAATSVCGKNHSVEPTYTNTVPMLDVAVNQQATFTWYAQPGFAPQAPAVAANGFGLQCQGIGGSGVAYISGVVFSE